MRGQRREESYVLGDRGPAVIGPCGHGTAVDLHPKGLRKPLQGFKKGLWERIGEEGAAEWSAVRRPRQSSQRVRQEARGGAGQGGEEVFAGTGWTGLGQGPERGQPRSCWWDCWSSGHTSPAGRMTAFRVKILCRVWLCCRE